MDVNFGDIRTDFQGFLKLVMLHNQINSPSADNYTLHFPGWIDANMCAPLGAIIKKKRLEGSKFKIGKISAGSKKIFLKNHFLTQFQLPPIHDTHKTTIKYKWFDTEKNAKEEFSGYVDRHFKSGEMGIPDMSPLLITKFRQSLYEVFLNSLEHSNSKHGVFACGQYFPQQNRLDFSIADLGHGIAQNIYKELATSLSPESAILWALSGNTTRRGKPGGLGLKLIQDFLELNNGRMIIVSHKGYGCIENGQVTTKSFTEPFPGTVVTIEINTADKSSYRLKDELNPEDIF